MEEKKTKYYYSFNIGICPFDNYSKTDNKDKNYGTKINDDIYLNYSVDVSAYYSNKIFQDCNAINYLNISYYPNDITQDDIDEDKYYISLDRGTLKYHHINFIILDNWFPENTSTKNYKIIIKMSNPIWYSKIGTHTLNYNPFGNYVMFEISDYSYDNYNKMNYIKINNINFYEFSERKIKEIEDNNLTKYQEIFT